MDILLISTYPLILTPLLTIILIIHITSNTKSNFNNSSPSTHNQRIDNNMQGSHTSSATNIHQTTQERNNEQKRRLMQRILTVNKGPYPSSTLSQQYGDQSDTLISFENINIHGISAQDEFIELINTMGILERMEAEIYIVVETQWDTSNPLLHKHAKRTQKRRIDILKWHMVQIWMSASQVNGVERWKALGATAWDNGDRQI